MNTHFKIAILLILCFGTGTNILAQEKTVELNFKKGEVLDILLLSNGPDVATFFPKYRETAFPVASKFSFKSVPGLPISKTVQGGVQPEAMIFGRWDSKEKREGFLKAIVPAVPDFHEQRRAIWSYFTLTYYEIQEDTNITIDRSKYNVVTSYWGTGKFFANYLEEFKTATQQQGGKEIITLTHGFSPVGYIYNPSYLTITQWANKEAFDRFYNKNEAMQEGRITNVHQFVLD